MFTRPLIVSLALLACTCTFDATGIVSGGQGGATSDGGTDVHSSSDATIDPPTTSTSPATSEGSASMSAGDACGDGVVDPDEECDEGQANADAADCKSDCTFNVCGDGHKGPGEGCDDGGLDDGDGCSALCVSESCGDGVVQANEGCDDGPANGAGQACKANCSPNVCGDGDPGPGEGCDDGNLEATDACTAGCQPATCGDGLVHAGVETCDDGNPIDTDACTTACAGATCGDGFVQLGVEECDDGNPSGGDGCDGACKVEVRRVFVSSVEYQGNLGGVGGADGKCEALAADAGLDGVWMAWISDYNGSSAPANRFVTKFNGPYVKVDGARIADSWADLTDGSLDSAINRTEKGTVVNTEPEVWTNTTPGGNKRPGDYECYNWTDNGMQQDSNGQIGNLNEVDGDWSDIDQTEGCASHKRIYCFEQ